MNNSHFPILAALSLAILAPLSACNSGQSQSQEQPPLAGAAIGGPFTLTGENGEKVSSDQFAGKYRLIYFGYTFCPDICPVDTQLLMQGLDQFSRESPELAEKIVPIFITLDPARDTPAVLKEWTDAFHPRLIGLTGSEDEVAAVAKQFAIYYKRGEDTPGGGYLVDHARMSLLLGPDGEPITLLSHDRDGATVAQELKRWVK